MLIFLDFVYSEMQEELAEILNVSGRTVSRWETGRNLPDISLLTTISDIYKVDVREIIEGERAGEKKDEIKEVTSKMAEYAVAEKNRMSGIIQIMEFIGVIFLTLAVILQCVFYSSGILNAVALIASMISLVIMVVITLYVVGILKQIVTWKRLFVTIKITTIVFSVISLIFVLEVLLVFGFGIITCKMPFHTVKGIVHYNKAELIKVYGADLDSGFMIFPDSTDAMISANYICKLKTGLMDTDGYIILEARYCDDVFDKEVKRLSEITCDLTYNGLTVTNKIMYNEEIYHYPAYITSDGYDYVYEYALIDKANLSIVYVLLSYPAYKELQEYKFYMKKNPDDYNPDYQNMLERYTIYAYRLPGMEGWLEYSN